MSRCQIITADVLMWAEEYDGPPFHALLCDPPYHLNSIIKRFAKTGGADRHFTKTGPYQRTGKGFMGQTWDGGDIAFQPETWAALGKHLHPGAFMMAFAGTRGYHRMACAIEDAGFIIHPLIIWCFGSGFPKATRIDTQIDAAAGVEGKPEREWSGGARSGGIMGTNGGTQRRTINGATTPAAQAWSGHRYGLQAMKPALECICVAQKPYAGRPVDSITSTGAGALNIDGGRVGGSGGPAGAGPGPKGSVYQQGLNGAFGKPVSGLGRWPANLCLDDLSAAMMDAQTGESISARVSRPWDGSRGYSGGLDQSDAGMTQAYGDKGGASRYYLTTGWEPEVAEPFFYTAKAGRVERDAGLDGMPLKENADWPQSLDGDDLRGASPRRNVHPTVKPLRLTRWLATLLLPPAEYAPRRILVPFAGSGSEAIGAALAGWDDVTGLEMSDEYAEIARARARFWQGNVGLFESLTAQDEEEEQQGVLDLA